MERIWRNCRTVNGIVTTRTSTVNTMIARPICEKLSTYNTNKVLSIGRMMISLQRSPNMAKISTDYVLDNYRMGAACISCIGCSLSCRSTKGC